MSLLLPPPCPRPTLVQLAVEQDEHIQFFSRPESWMAGFLAMDDPEPLATTSTTDMHSRYLYGDHGPTMVMRQFGADWILGVASEWGFQSEDLLDIVMHTIELFDRFIQTKLDQYFYVAEEQMLPYMAVCFLIVIKFQECNAKVTFDHLLHLIDPLKGSVPLPAELSPSLLAKCELDVVFTVQFDLYFITLADRLHVLRIFLSGINGASRTPLEYTAMLALIDASYLKYRPSLLLLAIGAICVNVDASLRLLGGRVMGELESMAIAMRQRLLYNCQHSQFANLSRLIGSQEVALWLQWLTCPQRVALFSPQR